MLGNLSLRYKFLMILGAVLVTATLAYFALAIQLFNKDKQAYVFDSVGALVETVGEETATGILSALKTMRLAALADVGDDAQTEGGAGLRAVRALFEDDDSFVVLALHRLSSDGQMQEPHVLLTQSAYLDQYEVTAAAAEAAARANAPGTGLLSETGLVFRNVAVAGGTTPLPLLGVGLGIKDETGRLTHVVSAFLRQDRRLAVFRRSSLYTTYLIDGVGNLLAHSDPARVERLENVGDSPFIQKVLASRVSKGVSEHEDAGGVRMIAYKKLGVGGLVAVSEIPKERAFLASRRLVEKSALFAVLILSLAFVVSIVFSRRLTAALNRLYLATQRVAKGDFNVEVAATTGDEVGALSKSFNHMTREINRLLVETADKARMEKELETAQLVQDNFFPKGDLEVNGFELSAFFTPASECGGDWWGTLRSGDDLILLIGDATGHGVPAALITAAAHSCATTLARLAERQHGLALTPAFILDMLNAAIFHAGKGRVKMTFFVAVIDTVSGRVRFANASHDQPLLGRAATGDELTPDSLAERPDACLGESLETRFSEHGGELGVGDILVLYTDGISECRNAAGEEYGERRLIRSLKKLGSQGAADIRSQIVADVRRFSDRPAPADDMTLVVVRRAHAARLERQAG